MLLLPLHTLLACGSPTPAPADLPMAEPSPTAATTGPFVVPEGEDEWAWQLHAAWHAPPFLVRLEPVVKLDGSSADFGDLTGSADGAVAWGPVRDGESYAYIAVDDAGKVGWRGRQSDLEAAWVAGGKLHLATYEGLRTLASGKKKAGSPRAIDGDQWAPGRAVAHVEDGLSVVSLPDGAELHRFSGAEGGWPRLRSDGEELVIVHEDAEPVALSVWDLKATPPTRTARHEMVGQPRVEEVSGRFRVEDDRGRFRVDGAELTRVTPAALAGSTLLSGPDREDHLRAALLDMELPGPIAPSGPWVTIVAEGMEGADDDDDDLWGPALAASHGAPPRQRLARLRVVEDAVTRVWRPAAPPSTDGDDGRIRATAVVEGLADQPPEQARVLMLSWEGDVPVGTAVSIDGTVVAQRTFTSEGLDGKVELEGDEDGPGTCSPEYTGVWVAPGRLLFPCGDQLLTWQVDTDRLERFASDVPDDVDRLLLAANGTHVLGTGAEALHHWVLADGTHGVAKLKDHGSLDEVLAVPGSTTDTSPLGDIVFASDEAGLIRVDAATGTVRWSHPPYEEGRLWESAVSPDGRWLALAPEFGPSLVIADAASGKMLRRTDEPFGGTVWDLDWTPDSRHLLADNVLLDADTLAAVAETRVVLDTSWVQARLGDGSWLVSDQAGRLLHVQAGGYGEGE